MPKEPNPLNKSERNVQRVSIELESDVFTSTEQDKIVAMVIKDAEANSKVMAEAKEIAKLDIQHYEGEKPSILENLTKEDWQSDRNLGLCAATCDIYQSTLLSTVLNVDSLHFKATEQNDVDNKDNLKEFAKWAIGPNEGNIQPEIDDYIHNKITMGFGAFYTYWKVWYDWVDKRIPKKIGGYTIKTEKMRFEKGAIENIANPLDDLLLPRHGKTFQDLRQFIHIIHTDVDDLRDAAKRKIYMNVDEELIDAVKGRMAEEKKATLEKEKAEKLGISDINDDEVSSYPIDLYCWYGWYKKGNRRERYRLIIEPITETFLSGKPLRKITRSGKYPFVGSPFIRRPGFLIGKSLSRLIAPVINAFNNVFNQKSDFQYVENCPFGFHNPAEGYSNQVYKLKPGVSYPVEGKPSETVYFPNIQRSFAWAEMDYRILFEVLEKLTGAAAYFMTTQRNASGTATRDMLVSEKSNNKFSFWVDRTMLDICEAITMFINMYQDWAPPKLGIRVLGENGKKLFPNLSIETLRGNYDAYMTPDLIAGSKSLEQQMKLWGFQNLAQTIWVDPRVNPKGNWNLVADTAKAMGYTNVERYLGPEPKAEMGSSREIDNEWARFMQGEVVDLIPGENPLEHLTGHIKQKEEKYFELDEEYRPNFDQHLLDTRVELEQFIHKIQQERMADQVAANIMGQRMAGGMLPQPTAQPPILSAPQPTAPLTPPTPGGPQ